MAVDGHEPRHVLGDVHGQTGQLVAVIELDAVS